MATGRPDPVIDRYIPDPELMGRAHAHLMGVEDIRSPQRRYIRHQWEAAFGAVRVGMDALRAIWPLDAELLEPPDRESLREALDLIEEAYVELDAMSQAVIGDIVLKVVRGEITSHEELDAMGVER